MNTKNTIVTNAFKDFNPRFLDEAFCREWILKQVYVDGVFCPFCGHRLTNGKLKRFFEGKRNICAACGKKFSTLRNTSLHATKLSYSELALVAFLSGIGYDPGQIALRLNRQRLAVRNVLEKLR